ncbi:AraC family transcriptional regulator [Streptomyces sp. NPDC026672]|uniref:AraC family transcriptional regulator n=1 Tax=unclassified Streptomyces TaxID=2593676 RepID=UPI0033FC15D3
MDPLERLRRIVERHAVAGETATAVPGVRLSRVDSRTLPTGKTFEPSVALIVQGGMRTVLGSRTLEYGAGQYAVTSVELPVTCAVTDATPNRPYLALTMRLDATVAAEVLLGATAGSRGIVTGRAAEGIEVNTADQDLLDAFARMGRLVEQPHHVPVLAPLYEREIVWRLICAEEGAAVRMLGQADSQLSQVSRAIGWLRNHYTESLRISELAGLASMGSTTFHRHFRALTRMTPLQYQKQLRLHEARARLMAGADDVAGIGHAVGYGSPSQFSREYRRLFGTSPGRDITHRRDTRWT